MNLAFIINNPFGFSKVPIEKTCGRNVYKRLGEMRESSVNCPSVSLTHTLQIFLKLSAHYSAVNEEQKSSRNTHLLALSEDDVIPCGVSQAAIDRWEVIPLLAANPRLEPQRVCVCVCVCPAAEHQ